jgi:ribosome maturation factor RimP
MAGQHGRPTADTVRVVVAPPVEAAGLYLEHVAVSRAGNRSVVRLTVDLPEDAVGSLDSDALGEVSRAVSGALDERDVVPGAYVLEVSTPGTSRPLTELRHFRRARTRLVTLSLHDGSAARFSTCAECRWSAILENISPALGVGSANPQSSSGYRLAGAPCCSRERR